MKGAKQTTLRDHVAVSGIGVHSGSPVNLTLHPADDDTGIVFQRVSADGTVEREIRADVRAVTATEFATVLGDAKGPLCSTAEHLLAALARAAASTMWWSRSTGRKFRSWTAARRPLSTRIDQAGLTTRALAAPLYRSDQAGARVPRTARTANFGPINMASGSRPKSNSIIR